MIYSSFGGLLKDYRIQKNISQQDIAFALGWIEPSRLSRIEQGSTRKPSRELIDRIIEILKLEEIEKNRLLLAGNYLPAIEEIEKIRQEFAPIINKWKYPAIVYDFGWRVMLENEPSQKVYSVYKLTKAKSDKITHIFEQLFHPDNKENKLFKGNELKQRHLFLLDVLVQFNHAQRMRTKESWYLSLLQKMMKNELFRELWSKSQLLETKLMITNFYLETVINPDNTNERLKFYLFAPPLIKDPRFEIDFFTPVDIETFRYFQ